MPSRTWAAAALWAVGQLATHCHALDDAPSVSEYVRRVFARTSVIGNYLYFDGGEVSQLENGKNLTYRASNPINHTLSIDLSSSWKPSEVTIKETSKGSAPRMMRQAIFTDNSSDAFYIWGGFASYNGKPPDAKLWKFNADGSGGGSWSTEIKPGHENFTQLTRSQGGVFVSTPDSGFYFGGYSQATSDKDPNGPVPGFLQFNYTDTIQAWTNHTNVPYSQYGTITGGAAHYIPTFGPNGLVMLFGGGEHVIGAGQSADNVGYLSFSTMYFMDPVTKVWYNQKTSGTAPSPRMWHCVVGAQGSNGTYEIFVFGGSNTASNAAYDEVFVLSLPGFVWKKADYESSSPRDCMGCAIAGQRQMVTVGGIYRPLGVPGFFRDKDPLPQGLGVFDLVDLKWKDEYDAGAAAYDTPDLVKSWYNDGNLASVEYTSDDVASLFAKSSESGSDSGSGASDGTDSHSSSTGAIVGGVVGGVGGVALIGALVWFLLRRRRKRQPAPAVNTPATTETGQIYAGHQHAYSPVPPSATIAASELDSRTPPPDIPKMIQPPELDANPRQYYELDGSGAQK
ncbi:Kelch repeat-containing protein [Colletotrichum orbiculare MAFF 240422]|uniref:Kelch repeat-containing protein n=1 Tax=Colletotrichum orbiculare (strain 104-T / ATCC 96160 / CBS 514.97 / LARS 414 / MAFF 240422) TaxID=1213857 RepID=N4V2Q5_COLOR|nr:Kelch repeat-containing protein [Colletotrichum orbiculare MAFF 240422]